MRPGRSTLTARPRPLVGALAWGCLLLALAGSVRAEESTADEGWLGVARASRPGVVRIQWRPRGGRGEVVERQAVVVDSEGWLVMAGPPARPDGTIAATFADGRSMGTRVWASDARSGLTLLRVPVGGLRALTLRRADSGARSATTPPRVAPGTDLVMVTAEGAIARGTLRANHRVWALNDPATGVAIEVVGLDENSLSVVSTDLGAPILDREGGVVGLLVGADVEVPDATRPPEEGFHLRPQVVAAYSMPSEVLAVVWPLLRDLRQVPRVSIGIRTRPLDEALSHHVCRDCAGWVVSEVAAESPAEASGLMVMDIVRGVNGKPLAPGAVLAEALLGLRPGDAVQLEVLRAGRPIDVEVVLGEGH